MSDTKAIADDYYINRLSNAKIFEKHGLDRQKAHISQERVFERLPVYRHKELQCCHCSSEMVSKYVSKTTIPLIDELSNELCNKDLQISSLVRVETGQKIESRWSRHKVAYAVNGGHRVSLPICTLCGHQIGDKCECFSCIEIKNNRASEAAEVILSELESLEPIHLDRLTYRRLLSLFKQLPEFINNVISPDFLPPLGYLNFEQKATLMALNLAALTADSVLPAIKMVSINEYYVDWNKIQFTIKSADNSIHFLTKLKCIALH